MRKIILTLNLVLFALVLNGCDGDIDNNEDAVLFQQIQGKWKLTDSFSDDQPINTPIANGYTIEFKADKTFLSDEENGYAGGTYTVLKSPANNIMLRYANSSGGKLRYKYIDQVTAQYISTLPSTLEPTPEVFLLGGLILTRIP